MNPSRKLVAAVSVTVLLAAGSTTADWNLGRELYDLGRYADAAVHFRAIVKSNPNWPSGYLMLGRCELALEEYDEALENLRTAVDLDPENSTNTVTLGRALMSLDRHTEARELLDGLDLGSLRPDWKAEVARMQAVCLLKEDRAADAVTLLEARLSDDPTRASLHRAIATAHKASGNREGALDDLARAYSLDPSDHSSGRAAVTAALSLATTVGDDDLTDDYYTRAIEIAAKLATAAPEYENTRLAGEAAFGAGWLEDAAGWFGKAVESRPQGAEARFDLGRTLAALGHDDEAISNLRAALGAAPGDELAKRIHGELGRLLACRLELPEAARHYRAAGGSERADQIDELAAAFANALERLNTLRSTTAELARMEAEVEALGDDKGVAALSGRRETMSREITEIEGNLSEVRTALCR